MRLVALLVVTISCASEPAVIQNRVAASGPSLDDLRFLAGCWQFYSVDYGFHVCWTRRAAAWVGSWQTLGPMARERNIVLAVAPRGGRLELTAIPSVDWFAGIDQVGLTTLRGNTVGFGAGETRITWMHHASDDTLGLIVGTRRYELARVH